MTNAFRHCERATFYPCPRFACYPRAPFIACPDSLSVRPRLSHRYCAPVDYYLNELVLTALSTSRALRDGWLVAGWGVGQQPRPGGGGPSSLALAGFGARLCGVRTHV